jgi:hypothetical protein
LKLSIIEAMGETVTEHVKEWWEGDGRGEHIIDVALPHEDFDEVEETEDPNFVPGLSANIAAVVCVLAFVGVIASVFVAFILDVF